MGVRDVHRTLRPEQFPVRFDIAARFADLDTLRHINNVAVAGIFAEARNMLIREMFTRTARPAGLRFIVGQVAISYLGEAHYPAIFEIANGILAVGTSSFRICQAFFDRGCCTSVAETVMIATDAQRPVPLADAIRAVLQDLSVSHIDFPRLLQPAT